MAASRVFLAVEVTRNQEGLPYFRRGRAATGNTVPRFGLNDRARIRVHDTEQRGRRRRKKGKQIENTYLNRILVAIKPDESDCNRRARCSRKGYALASLELDSRGNESSSPSSRGEMQGKSRWSGTPTD